MNGTTAGCGCCACLAGAGKTIDVANRPGLSALHYRVGTYATFYDAMIRRLTVPVDPKEKQPYPLLDLRTRESDDASIALLDGWATVADVLTFYQERIANEGFLRTATERRSILELGRLIGYTLKPGVSSSVYLAYTLDPTADTVIPAGTKAQSVPGAGEQPQMFETSENTTARGTWNALLPRMHKPQKIALDTVLNLDSIWIDGTTTRINKRDPLLFVFEATTKQTKETFYALRIASSTNADTANSRTEIVLEPVRPYYTHLYDVTLKVWAADVGEVPAVAVKPKKRKAKVAAGTTAAAAANNNLSVLRRLLQQTLLGMPRFVLEMIGSDVLDPSIKEALRQPDTDQPPPVLDGGPKDIEAFLAPLVAARGIPPPSQWQMSRSLSTSLTERSDYVPRLLTTFYPQLDRTIYAALSNIATGVRPYPEFRSVSVLRKRASAFGYNAPTILFEDRPTNAQTAPPIPSGVNEDVRTLYLDTADDAIAAGSFVVAQQPTETFVASVVAAESTPRTAYGISTKTTRLTLSDPWAFTFQEMPNDDTRLQALIANLEQIRNTSILAESEVLTLAQQPLDRPIGKKADKGVKGGESETRIELDGVVDGLGPGRWVIVTGEREDTAGTTGIVSAELAMIDNVEQQTDSGAGGTSFSILDLAPAGLAYQYKRETVKIYGNVVKATNGETRSEILGGGDGSKGMQSFTLHQSPLTYISAPTIAGVASTLAIRVNDVLWHETDSLADAAPADRVYITKTANDGKVTVVFGNGRTGARLPTGADNVRAVYRSGIGKGGNVSAGQISTAISRPLGVQGVTNPIEASGGADPESRDDARRAIPVSLQAMGRVVSVQDYADFARTFAGIAKASAVALSDGRRRLVHLTIGGTDDIDIDVTSDLYQNLIEALRQYGDPYQPLEVAVRAKIVIAGSARVQVQPDYLWTAVAPNIRAALLDKFAYGQRDFGQPVYPAEVVAAIQNVKGVAWVDLQDLGGIRSTNLVRFAAPVKRKIRPLLMRGPNVEGLRNVIVNPVAMQTAQPSLPKIRGVRTILPRLAHTAHHAIQPAEIAYLPPDVADLFILTEMTTNA